ncbi:MAG: PQQ-dependent sugar dehydrogenase, partial [Myxococcota bacterium]
MNRALPLLLAMALAACGDDTSDPPADGGPTDGGAPEGPFVTFETLTLSDEGGLFTAIAPVPGTEDEVFVTRYEGVIAHYRLEGTNATLLGEITVPEVFTLNDCGLLAVAADPDFATNGFVFAGHCIEGSTTRITRLTFTGDHAAASATAVTILEVPETRARAPFNHNVSNIVFEPDGSMIVGVGDKGFPANGQDTGTLAAAILRIEPSRAEGVGGYEPAADNPDLGGSPELFAIGARFPWRIEPLGDGRYWFGDVGESSFEEVNLLGAPGENFGWNECEGPCDTAGLVDPLFRWDRSDAHPYVREDPDALPTVRRSAWIGPVYPGGASDRYAGRLTGKVLFGDVCLGFVRAGAATEAGGVASDEPVGHLANAVGWAIRDGFYIGATFGSCDANDVFE